MMTSSVLQMLEGKFLDQGEMTPKQKAVLEAAIELFAEKGFASTSTSEIAKKAGVAEGTIFKYFETKEKLLYATILPILLHDLFPIQADLFREAVLEKEYFDFATFIDVLIDNRFAFLQENHSLFKILFTELMYRAEIKQVLLEVFTNKIAGALEHLLEKMKAEKVIVDWDNRRIARTVLVQLLGYAVPRLCIFPDHQWDDKQELAIVKSNILKILLLS